MTNIWASNFEEIRKPHFDIEDPYTLREKKEKEEKPKRWWDDDGDGKGYEKGEVGGSFKKKVKKEEVEQIDEISQKLATKAYATSSTGEFEGQDSPRDIKRTDNLEKHIKRKFGDKAVKHAERAAHSMTFGRRGAGGMPPVKEETLYTSKSAQKMVDVKKGIKNKIVIGPQVREEVEEWVDQLVNEGYDLSEFTWDEITNIYLDEAGGSSAIPPAGDAETKRIDPMEAAKARAAKAKVTKEIADLQVAKQAQRTKVSTTESVIQYLAQRSDPFEDLEEGVFDPKKSKMRPASERSKNAMTDAQRKAAKTEQDRVTKIHSKGETVLAGLTSSGRRGRVDTAPKSKPAAPEANRKVKGKYDTLAKKASAILKSV